MLCCKQYLSHASIVEWVSEMLMRISALGEVMDFVQALLSEVFLAC